MSLIVIANTALLCSDVELQNFNFDIFRANFFDMITTNVPFLRLTLHSCSRVSETDNVLMDI